MSIERLIGILGKQGRTEGEIDIIIQVVIDEGSHVGVDFMEYLDAAVADELALVLANAGIQECTTVAERLLDSWRSSRSVSSGALWHEDGQQTEDHWNGDYRHMPGLIDCDPMV